jgi:hypothetical protein
MSCPCRPSSPQPVALPSVLALSIFCKDSNIKICKFFSSLSTYNTRGRDGQTDIMFVLFMCTAQSTHVTMISLWLPTAAARVRSRVWLSGICGGQRGAGAGFLRVLRFPLPIFIASTAPQSPSPIIWGWYNRPEVAAVQGT